MWTRRNVSLAVLVGSLWLGAAPNAAEPSNAAPTKEMRATMAAAHEKMAACLRSDKAMAVCHEEMRKNAPMMHEQGCPMMQGQHGPMHKGAQKPTTDQPAHEH